MQEFVHIIAQVGKAFEHYCKQANYYGIFFKRVHDEQL